MARLVIQEKQRKILNIAVAKKGRVDEIYIKSEGICLWKDKGYFLHSKTEVETGQVAKGWEMFKKKWYIK